MSDVMERLQAANPVREAPALPPIEPLLAQLDDVPVKQRRRRPVWVLAPALAAVVAVFVGLELRGGTDVIAEAREALGGTGGITHIAVRDERFNPDGTLVTRSGQRSEIWVARNPLRLHSREGNGEGDYADGVFRARRIGGRIETTARLTPAQQREFEDPDANVGLTQLGYDPTAVIRKLLAAGELRHDGSTEIAGRAVERLVGSIPADDQGAPAVAVEYLVDGETYVPVRLTTKATTKDGRPAGSSRMTFLEYDKLPLNAETEKLLVLQ